MIKITVEELDIIVQASVEQALVEFKKIVPQLKKTMRQVEDNLNNVETKGMVTKVQQVVQQVKQKVNEVKNTGIDKQLQTQFDKAGASVEKYQGQLEQLKEKLRQVYADMDTIQTNTWKQYTPEGVELGNKAIEPAVNNALGDNKQYQSLSKEATKLEQQITALNSKLNTTKQQYNQIAGQIQEVTSKQGLWGNAVNKVRSIIDNVKKNIKGAKDNFEGVSAVTEKVKNGCSQILSVTTKVTSRIKQIGTGFKQGVGHVLKYAAALISLESIYGALSGVANAWLSSQNAGAQQLSANIDYMKYALGSALAPVIQTITNLVYNLLKAIQSVVYALTGINIFANASAKSYASMANSAKKAAKETKQLAGVHDEINNIQETNPEGGNNGGTVAPSFDLSQLNPTSSILDAIKNGNWYEVGQLVAEKINDALSNIDWSSIQNTAKNIATNIGNFINGFVDGLDWNLLGSTIGNGINTAFIFANTLLTTINWGSIGSSIANFLNSTISTTNWSLIGQTFANGLNAIINFGFNFITTFDWIQFGTSIGQSISSFIQNIDWATAGQALGNGIIGMFNSISSFLSEVDWAAIGEGVKTFMQNIDWVGIWEAIKETIISAIGSADDILTSLFGEGGSTVIESIAIAIAAVVTALELYNTIATISATVTATLASPITIIIGIIALLVAAIITIAKNWNEVSAALSAGWEWIKEKATEIFTAIGEFFSNIWQSICDTATNVWNGIKDFFVNIWTTISDFFSNIWNGIKNVAISIWDGITTTISNVINGIKNTIQNVLDTISSIWNNIWNGIKNAVVNVWNGIWNTIKGVINSILGGIEGMANGVVNGVNAIIRVLNNLHFNIPDWVPGFGGKSFGFNIPQLSRISLPRLAKGAVLKVPTVAEMAEYPGASQNPEIVTPQNIMRETMEDVFSQYLDNEQPININLTLNVGNEKLGKILLDDLRNMKRRSGKGIEALVN